MSMSEYRECERVKEERDAVSRGELRVMEKEG